MQSTRNYVRQSDATTMIRHQIKQLHEISWVKCRDGFKDNMLEAKATGL